MTLNIIKGLAAFINHKKARFVRRAAHSYERVAGIMIKQAIKL